MVLDVKTGDGTLLPLNTDAGFGVGPPAVREAEGLAGRWAPTFADFQAAFAAARNWPVNDAARAALTTAFTQPRAVLGICADSSAAVCCSFFPDLREIEIGASAVVIRYQAQGQNVARVVHLDQTTHPAASRRPCWGTRSGGGKGRVSSSTPSRSRRTSLAS